MTRTVRRSPALRAAAKPVVVIVVLAMSARVHACPMCKDGVVDTQQKNGVADTAGLNFNHSIYTMLGGMGLICGITGRVMYKATKSV